MKTLTQMLEEAMIERSCRPNTRSTYHLWVKKFFQHCKKPASIWTPADVREWMLSLHSQNYSNTKRVTPHTLRHGFVTHALEAGNDLAVVQKLVGHEDVNTTMIYAHGDRARGFSPLDFGASERPVFNPAQNLLQ